MSAKLLTLRKISTGGKFVIAGKNAREVINRLHLDPVDWEEAEPEQEKEAPPDGED